MIEWVDFWIGVLVAVGIGVVLFLTGSLSRDVGRTDVKYSQANCFAKEAPQNAPDSLRAYRICVVTFEVVKP